MTIGGKVHCFFEQSGTFKREFIKMGIHAEDYDVLNDYGETDHQGDLFQAFSDAYDGKPSLFDGITEDDLIMAFFPCIYFCGFNSMNMTWKSCEVTYRYDTHKASEWILERARKRDVFFNHLVKMVTVAQERHLRLILENPWGNSYLNFNFVKRPDIIDTNRKERGDLYVKPTAYWFFNCTPTRAVSYDAYKGDKATIKKTPPNKDRGRCGTERSLIKPAYARNFICDFILGGGGGRSNAVPQQLDMFDLQHEK